MDISRVSHSSIIYWIIERSWEAVRREKMIFRHIDLHKQLLLIYQKCFVFIWSKIIGWNEWMWRMSWATSYDNWRLLRWDFFRFEWRRKFHFYGTKLFLWIRMQMHMLVKVCERRGFSFLRSSALGAFVNFVHFGSFLSASTNSIIIRVVIISWWNL